MSKWFKEGEQQIQVASLTQAGVGHGRNLKFSINEIYTRFRFGHSLNFIEQIIFSFNGIHHTVEHMAPSTKSQKVILKY